MLTESQFQTIAKFQERWSTDPMLGLARRLLNPEYESTRIYVPDQLKHLVGNYITCTHGNWINALNTLGRLLEAKQAYREVFIYLMDYLNEIVNFANFMVTSGNVVGAEIRSHLYFLKTTSRHIMGHARYIEAVDSTPTVYCYLRFAADFIDANYKEVVGLLEALRECVALDPEYMKCLIDQVGASGRQARTYKVDLAVEAEFYEKQSIGHPKEYFGNPMIC